MSLLDRIAFWIATTPANPDVCIEFEPRDMWLGVYLDVKEGELKRIYICLLPMLPIVLRFGGAR